MLVLLVLQLHFEVLWKAEWMRLKHIEDRVKCYRNGSNTFINIQSRSSLKSDYDL